MMWLAPLLAGLALLILLPLGGTLLLAFFEYDVLSAPRWVGLEHFQALTTDDRFRQALANSLLIAIATVPLRVLLALLLLPLFSRPGLAGRLALLLLLLPVVIPEIVWSTAWLWLLNPHFGPVAWALEAWHPLGGDWLLSVAGARSSLVLIGAFLVGEMLLILVLARRQIPAALYDLASLEGLGPWGRFRLISLPVLLPLILLLAARDFALALQASFISATVVTKGGPQFATYLLPQYIFENGFEYLRFGYAAAISSILLALTIAILIAQALLLSRWLPARSD